MIEDSLGPLLADMLGWAAEREEPWTTESLALELVIRDLVREKRDLVRYSAAIDKELDTFGGLDQLTIRSRDEAIHGLIQIDRLRSCLTTLAVLTYQDVARATAISRAHEANRQEAAGRPEQAKAAEDEALDWADRAAEAEQDEQP